ncbi:MAG: PAS domain-containing sensor histidine kinase [Pseudomonadota bacterium]
MFGALKKHLKLSPSSDIWAGPGEDVIAIHAADGRIEKISEGARSVFGVPADALIGRRLMDIVAPAHQIRLLQALAQVAHPNGDGVARFACRVRVGETLGAAVEIGLSRGAGGRLRSVTRNVEDRVRSEEEALAESQRTALLVAQRGEQLANVSHEIRTPLNAVIGFADAICAERFGPMGNDKYRDYAKVIHESGQHLLSLISDLLDLSKAEANETAITLEPQSPKDIVRFCAEVMRLRAEADGLYLRTEVDPTLETALLDVKIVRQIVLNLLSNAVKFTESGGVTLSVRREGAVITFSVVDTGVGMAPDELALVGTRFKQARAEGVRGVRGTGIGLSLSKALARVHGGELRLVSAAGTGTTALLRLPYEAAGSGDVGHFEDEVTFPPNVTRLDDIRRA